MQPQIEQHTALYTPLDIEYAQEMSGPYEEVAVENQRSYAAVAALKDGRVTGLWRPVVVFGNEVYQRKRIEGLWCYSQDILYEDYLVDGQLSPVSRFLLERGYCATPVYTQVIDLTLSETLLRQQVRKSYKSLIHKTDDVWACDVHSVRAIHLKARGVTRSDASWQIQGRMQTVCFADGERAAVMFYQGPVWAYYACAAGDDGHAALWLALLELQSRGVQFVEMGDLVFAGDAKKVGISRYKMGFGGTTKMRLLLRKGLQ